MADDKHGKTVAWARSFVARGGQPTAVLTEGERLVRPLLEAYDALAAELAANRNAGLDEMEQQLRDMTAQDKAALAAETLAVGWPALARRLLTMALADLDAPEGAEEAAERRKGHQEHLADVEVENERLRGEVRELRAKVRELERENAKLRKPRGTGKARSAEAAPPS